MQHDHCLHNERNGNIKPWEHKGKSKTASSLNLARNRYHWVTSLGTDSTIFKKLKTNYIMEFLTKVGWDCWETRLDQRFTRDNMSYLSRFHEKSLRLVFYKWYQTDLCTVLIWPNSEDGLEIKGQLIDNLGEECHLGTIWHTTALTTLNIMFTLI